jgi:hypothetical protein
MLAEAEAVLILMDRLRDPQEDWVEVVLVLDFQLKLVVPVRQTVAAVAVAAHKLEHFLRVVKEDQV